MTMLRFSRFGLSLVLALSIFVTSILAPEAFAAEEPVPVVIAVDTSRSLDAGALARVVATLGDVLDGLPEDASAALLAFDDSPRWIRPVGTPPAEVKAALDELRLQGRFTLLYDALFVATRELPDGGVVLLATDGRDENSAVLVEDIARRCEAQDVRIVSVGTGMPVEELSLRRLALVSEGAYVGTIDSADTAAVVSAIAAAREAIATGRDSATTAAAATTPGTAGSDATGSTPTRPGPPAQTVKPTENGGIDPLWLGLMALGLGALVLAAVLVGGALARRRKTPDEEEPETVEEPDPDEDAADEAEAGMIRLELAQAEAATPREAPEVTVDTAVFQKMTLDERLDRTRVLSNHSVLLMRKQGETPRTFLLDDSKAFAVGRDRHKNTLAVPDPALSAQHFKIVRRDEAFYFVDLDSTNGSFVNDRKMSAKRLRHGDTIRAGQVEFEYQDFGRGRS